MAKGGWESLDKACPKNGCNGVLLAKALGQEHLALKCTMGDFEKRGSTKEVTTWLENH